MKISVPTEDSNRTWLIKFNIEELEITETNCEKYRHVEAPS